MSGCCDADSVTGSRLLLALLGVASVVLAAVATWLVLHNPSIDDTSRGDGYACSAPYDTVLNDADNVPGGEPPPDSDEIAARCVVVGEDRFAQGSAAAVSAAMLAAAALVGLGRPQRG